MSLKRVAHTTFWQSVVQCVTQTSGTYDIPTECGALCHSNEWHIRHSDRVWCIMSLKRVAHTTFWQSVVHCVTQTSGTYNILTECGALCHSNEWHIRHSDRVWCIMSLKRVAHTTFWQSVVHCVTQTSGTYNILTECGAVCHPNEWHIQHSDRVWCIVSLKRVAHTTFWQSVVHYVTQTSGTYDILTECGALCHSNEWHIQHSDRVWCSVSPKRVAHTTFRQSVVHYVTQTSGTYDILTECGALCHSNEWHIQHSDRVWCIVSLKRVAHTTFWQSVVHYVTQTSGTYDILTECGALCHSNEWHIEHSDRVWCSVSPKRVAHTTFRQSVVHCVTQTSGTYDILTECGALCHSNEWYIRHSDRVWCIVSLKRVAHTTFWQSVVQCVTQTSGTYDIPTECGALCHSNEWHIRHSDRVWCIMSLKRVAHTTFWQSVVHCVTQTSGTYNILTECGALCHSNKWHIRHSDRVWCIMSLKRVAHTTFWQSVVHCVTQTSGTYNILTECGAVFTKTSGTYDIPTECGALCHSNEWHIRHSDRVWCIMSLKRVAHTTFWQSVVHCVTQTSGTYNILTECGAVCHPNEWHIRHSDRVWCIVSLKRVAHTTFWQSVVHYVTQTSGTYDILTECGALCHSNEWHIQHSDRVWCIAPLKRVAHTTFWQSVVHVSLKRVAHTAFWQSVVHCVTQTSGKYDILTECGALCHSNEWHIQHYDRVWCIVSLKRVTHTTFWQSVVHCVTQTSGTNDILTECGALCHSNEWHIRHSDRVWCIMSLKRVAHTTFWQSVVHCVTQTSGTYNILTECGAVCHPNEWHIRHSDRVWCIVSLKRVAHTTFWQSVVHYVTQTSGTYDILTECGALCHSNEWHIQHSDRVWCIVPLKRVAHTTFWQSVVHVSLKRVAHTAFWQSVVHCVTQTSGKYDILTECGALCHSNEWHIQHYDRVWCIVSLKRVTHTTFWQSVVHCVTQTSGTYNILTVWCIVSLKWVAHTTFWQSVVHCVTQISVTYNILTKCGALFHSNERHIRHSDRVVALFHSNEWNIRHSDRVWCIVSPKWVEHTTFWQSVVHCVTQTSGTYDILTEFGALCHSNEWPAIKMMLIYLNFYSLCQTSGTYNIMTECGALCHSNEWHIQHSDRVWCIVSLKRVAHTTFWQSVVHYVTQTSGTYDILTECGALCHSNEWHIQHSDRVWCSVSPKRVAHTTFRQSVVHCVTQTSGTYDILTECGALCHSNEWYIRHSDRVWCIVSLKWVAHTTFWQSVVQCVTQTSGIRTYDIPTECGALCHSNEWHIRHSDRVWCIMSLKRVAHTTFWQSVVHCVTQTSGTYDILTECGALCHSNEWHIRHSDRVWCIVSLKRVAHTTFWQSVVQCSPKRVAHTTFRQSVVHCVTQTSGTYDILTECGALCHSNEWHIRHSDRVWCIVSLKRVAHTTFWQSVVQCVTQTSGTYDIPTECGALCHSNEWHIRHSDRVWCIVSLERVAHTTFWQSVVHCATQTSGTYDILTECGACVTQTSGTYGILTECGTLCYSDEWQVRHFDRVWCIVSLKRVAHTTLWQSVVHCVTETSDTYDILTECGALCHSNEWHKRHSDRVWCIVSLKRVAHTTFWQSVVHYVTQTSGTYDILTECGALCHSNEWHIQHSDRVWCSVSPKRVAHTTFRQSVVHCVTQTSGTYDILTECGALCHTNEWHIRHSDRVWCIVSLKRVAHTTFWQSVVHCATQTSGTYDILTECGACVTQTSGTYGILTECGTLCHSDEWQIRHSDRVWCIVSLKRVAHTTLWQSVVHCVTETRDTYDILTECGALCHSNEWHIQHFDSVVHCVTQMSGTYDILTECGALCHSN